jgi:hypothetical protein
MREPLQVDQAYYHNYDASYSKFADAVMDVGPSPCVKFNCTRFKQCAEEKVECKAFRFWVNNGEMETYSKKVKGMVSIEKDLERILRICE